MNYQERVWKVGAWVGTLLAIFLAVLIVKQFISIKYVGKETPIYNSISVNGKGEAVSIPDIATFSFGVSENAKTVKEAQTKAADKINAALAAVRTGGVAEKDIKTLSYSIAPHYDYPQGVCTQYGCPSGKPVLDGYDVNQAIQVKVRDLAKAGELFDTLGATGIKTVDGLSFAIDDIDSVKAEARAEAIANAKEKAEKIAKDLGVKLVKITSFYDSSDDGYYPYAREGAMGGDMMSVKASVAPEIPKGEQKVTATVSITYEIR
ncbi:MAG: SIMPL domain-containing protein [Patescibacteria group bacterium]